MRISLPFVFSLTLASLLGLSRSEAAPAAPVAPKPALETGRYRNLFGELLGKTDAEVDRKIEAYWQSFANGNPETQRLLYPIHDDMAYIPDVGNRDVRSEGISYGLMLCVQTNHQKEFNQLWKFAKTYMYHPDGPMRGYFTWHTAYNGSMTRDDGSVITGDGPAPDGEEWVTMALFFAANRWGSGEGIFNYAAEAQALLHTMLHKEEFPDRGTQANMFHPTARMVRFVPDNGGSANTDASYHLPHYYELWARWASAPEDRAFLAEAAKVSRQLFVDVADKNTGLMPNQSPIPGIAPAGRRGGAGPGGGARRGGGAGAPALPDAPALTAQLQLTPEQAAVIAPLLDAIARAQVGLTTLQAAANAATVNDRIMAVLNARQKMEFVRATNANGGPGGNGGFAEDAWRTLAWPALDWSWWGADPREVEQSNRVLKFLALQPVENWPYHFNLDGTPTIANDDSPGMHAMAAVAGLAADPALARPFVQHLWDMPIPDDSDPKRDHTGAANFRAMGLERSHRYYDGLLAFLAMLQVSGHFRIYAPPAAK
ncbi:MAG: glycosyl hydrolase family 8 [Verrucomicrobiota bacterium]